MTEQRINDALGELRKQIDGLEIGDQAAKDRLATLVENIEQRLDSQGESDDDHDLVDEMKEAITHFEVEHPRITGIINDIMMALGNLGI